MAVETPFPVNIVSENTARFWDMYSPSSVQNAQSYRKGKQYPSQIIHNPLIYF